MKLFLNIIFLTIFSINSFAAESELINDEVFEIYTESNFAPFNYQDEKGNHHGISIEIINEILKDAKFKHTKIKLMPWARAYDITKKRRNTLLFSIFRTPFREDLFDWIGPVGTSNLVLLKKRSTTINPKRFKVSALRDSASMQTAIKSGVPDDNIIKLNTSDLGLNLLLLGRVDAWAISDRTARETIKEKGLDIKNFETYKILAQRDIYFALNKQTNPKIKKFFKERMQELQASGFIDNLLTKYNCPKEVQDSW